MQIDFLFLVGGSKATEEMIYDKAAIGVAVHCLPRNFYSNEGMVLKFFYEYIEFWDFSIKLNLNRFPGK